MTTTPLPPPGVNIAAGNWTAVTDCRYFTADQMQTYAQQARADLEAENQRLRELLEGVLKIGRGTSGRIIIEGWQEEVIRAALKGSNHEAT